jgi:hypothetical protein
MGVRVRAGDCIYEDDEVAVRFFRKVRVREWMDVLRDLNNGPILFMLMGVGDSDSDVDQRGCDDGRVKDLAECEHES